MVLSPSPNTECDSEYLQNPYIGQLTKGTGMNVSWEPVSPGRLRVLASVFTYIVPSEVWGQKNRTNPQCSMGLYFLACSVREAPVSGKVKRMLNVRR